MTSASLSPTASLVEADSVVEDDACRSCRAHAEHGCSRDASLDGPGRERHCRNEVVEEVAMKDMVEAGTWTKETREQDSTELICLQLSLAGPRFESKLFRWRNSIAECAKGVRFYGSYCENWRQCRI